MTAPPSLGGLRERSKTRRRRHILHTALRLFAEHGYERTTISDIAAAADVAPRTVTGYFPSKLDFIAEWPTVRTERLITLYDQQPGIGFIDLVDLWWTDARATVDPEEAALTRAMAVANPGVVAMAEAEVARRASRDDLPAPERPDHEPHHLIQVAGHAAIRGISDAYFRGIADGQMTDDLHAALLELVRSVANTAHAGHGALAPNR